jgi:glycosyltransferase involved in cell wall biosynthesis
MHGTEIPDASIIVASHRSHFIAKCLDGLKNTGARKASFEIIVVADYPVEQFAQRYPTVTWKFHNDKNIPVKRNIGIALSQSEVIGFIDDDCIPCENWIDAGMRYFLDHPESAGVFGRTIVEETTNISFPLKEFKRLQRPSFRTNNIFYKKKIIVSVGRFDERFSVQREDMDLAFSLLGQGYDLGFCADMTVLHCFRQNEPWDLVKNCFNRRFDPLLFKKHTLLYRKWIVTPFTGSIGLVMFLHIAVCLNSFFGPYLFGCSLVLDGVFILMMSVKRTWRTKINVVQFLCDGLSYCIAPVVLTVSLFYGSVKFKKFLLW